MERKLLVYVQTNKNGELEKAVFVVDEDLNGESYQYLVNEETINKIKNEVDSLNENLLTTKNIKNVLTDEAKELGLIRNENFCPVYHADASDKYGMASSDKYGHMKLITSPEEYEEYKDSDEHAVSAELLEKLLDKYE